MNRIGIKLKKFLFQFHFFSFNFFFAFFQNTFIYSSNDEHNKSILITDQKFKPTIQ